MQPSDGFPELIHVDFVYDHEVHAVVNSLKQQGDPNYLEEVLHDTQTTADGQRIGATGLPESGSGDSDDELYDQAVAWVLESRRASISSVQRQFRVEIGRAHV